jgi:hypothetical protein
VREQLVLSKRPHPTVAFCATNDLDPGHRALSVADVRDEAPLGAALASVRDVDRVTWSQSAPRFGSLQMARGRRRREGLSSRRHGAILVGATAGP